MIHLYAKIGGIFNKLKIPTLLGLAVITLGISAGVVMVIQFPNFTSKASPDQQPKEVTISNITDESATISWQTVSPTAGFVTYGEKSVSASTALDDRDSKTTTSRNNHYITLKKLTSKTTYQYQIFSGKTTDAQIRKFTTANPSLNLNKLEPVIGSVVNGNLPVSAGIAYLSFSGSLMQSALIMNGGSFIIPLAQIYQDNLSDILSLDEKSQAFLKIVTDAGVASVTFPLTVADKPIGPIHIGDNLTLTPASPSAAPVVQNIYDLNSDGLVNANDYSIALKNKGKKIKTVRKDLVTERIIDQKYLDELTKKVNDENPT